MWERVRELEGERGARGVDEPRRPAPAEAVLALQRGAGNQAVSRLLQRMPFDKYLQGFPKTRPDAFTHFLTKADLYKYLTEVCQQDKGWASAALGPVPTEWKGEFTAYGGRFGYEPPEPDYGPDMTEILRILGDAGSGRLKNAVIDYAGANQRDGSYKWCTQSFVEKHVLPDDSHKSAEKQGKARMATQGNITANSVLEASSMFKFQGEVAARQKEYEEAYEQQSRTALAAGSVVRGVDFTTQTRYAVQTLSNDTVKTQNAPFHYSVVKIGKEYLVNHFGGVA
jgi:hypothetical protein